MGEEVLEWLEELPLPLEFWLMVELLLPALLLPLLFVSCGLVLQPHRMDVSMIALDRAMIEIIFFIWITIPLHKKHLSSQRASFLAKTKPVFLA